MCAYRGWKPQGGERPRRRPLWLPGREAAREAQGLGPSQVATSRRQVWCEEKVPRLWCALMLCVFVFWHGQHLSTFICFFDSWWTHLGWWSGSRPFDLKRPRILMDLVSNEENMLWKTLDFDVFLFDGFYNGQNLGSLQRLGKLHSYIRFWWDVSSKSGCSQQKRWI